MAQSQGPETLPDEFQSLQRDLQNHIQSRQSTIRLMREHQEFSNLDNNTNIYKLCGPVLLRQDRTEAVLAVDARIEFINNEIKRVEKQIEDVQSKCNAIREKVC
ncbi:hypothetical protein Golomagni_00663 [Golovinomyces magnicellulatus]|nr:hypothetical protein Golomagni_00663 [Golovinomyces magnicellulatus]